MSPLSAPPAYRTVQNRFPINNTKYFFNFFRALTVITQLLLIAAESGLSFDFHETRKKCFPAVNADLLTKETF